MATGVWGYTGRNDRKDTPPRSREGTEKQVDIFLELVKAALTLGAMAAIIVLLGALFIIVLSLATGIDDHIQPDEDRR